MVKTFTEVHKISCYLMIYYKICFEMANPWQKLAAVKFLRMLSPYLDFYFIYIDLYIFLPMTQLCLPAIIFSLDFNVFNKLKVMLYIVFDVFLISYFLNFFYSSVLTQTKLSISNLSNKFIMNLLYFLCKVCDFFLVSNNLLDFTKKHYRKTGFDYII